MQKQSYQDAMTSTGDRNEEPDQPKLKMEINELLWTNLAPSTTLVEAESIACKMVIAIQDAWELHRREESAASSPAS